MNRGGGGGAKQTRLRDDMLDDDLDAQLMGAAPL